MPMASISSANPLISINGVSKTYRTNRNTSTVALSSADLQIKSGEFISFVGPSGCGKTTLLNIISGLIRPTAGTIAFDGQPLTEPSSEISLVFQKPVLLPWRTILENVMLPIEILGLTPRGKYLAAAKSLLDMVGLSGFENAYPRELSGGMQQRASIARALIYDTRVLLMDEPFAALDAMTRDELNLELLRIWKMTGKTIVFVTHNIPEAVLLSNRVVVMSARPGKVREVIDVDIPGERNQDLIGNPQFGHIVGHIRGLLQKVETRHDN
ncbi:ABC transporter ATP-binding protein [Rhizobium puerariae]|uniref:ABC transporter ATP-binding protein n=1 Tax=Rhizobium puerariae TaxID=1585791 RepID=A0ABV6AMT1_9HYPH